jgi:hypothetical protein
VIGLSAPTGEAAVSGGYFNTASGFSTSISGGAENVVSGVMTSVLGGLANTASGGTFNEDKFREPMPGGSVSGGQANTASSTLSSISGGVRNYANSNGAWVGGGDGDPVSGPGAMRVLGCLCL